MAGIVRPSDNIIRRLRSDNQNKENAARLAHAFGVWETTGWGEFEPEDAIRFDAPYLDRPSVGYGSSLRDDDDTAQLRSTRFPRCSGTVKDWDQDKNGFYTAAWVIITVEDRSALVTPTDPDPDPTYHIVHDFTFLGVAFKDILPHMRGDLREV
jgi:hypothetical protein